VPSTRFYKARTWINKWDAAGGETLRNLFLDCSETPPALVFSSKDAESAAVVFSMGLGFTGFTERTLREFESWIRLHKGKHGDAIGFHERLIDDKHLLKFFSVYGVKAVPHFSFLVPREWDLDRWLGMAGGDSERTNPSQDYAIILRYTTQTGKGATQVRFLLAGFTERGTAAAAKYLVHNWDDLHKEYFPHGRPEEFEESRGDFLLVIHGHSSADFPTEWTPKHFPVVTPQSIFKLRQQDPDVAACSWAKRFVRTPPGTRKVAPTRARPR